VRPFNPLVSSLPRLLHVRDPRGGFLPQLVSVAIAESRENRAGGESVLARLSELLFVEAVRRHLESLPAEHTGWLAGLRDPFVGRALTALHERPAHDWTIEELAREAALSRSALAERFARLVGVPPIVYLTQWRMQIAAGLLSRGAKVSAVALDVGYDSEAAFSRAFKKIVGVPPATWRDGSADGAGREAPPGSGRLSPSPKGRVSAGSASPTSRSKPARRKAAAHARTSTSRRPRRADSRR
jgi:AraC-like DNA-binding protein